jgi:hypothetical protein
MIRPLTIKNNRALPLIMVIKSTNCMILKLTVQFLFCLQGFSQCDAKTLTFDLNRIFPLFMVIECIKLYDPKAYSSVFILPTMVFLLSDAMTLTFDLCP